MADYYSILEKTISGLSKNTPEIRDAVYKKARAAIENQLRSMQTVPSEEAISSQLKLLEEAIVLIDSEHAEKISPVIEQTSVAETTPEPMTTAEPAPMPAAAPAPMPAAAPAPAAPAPKPIVENVTPQNIKPAETIAPKPIIPASEPLASKVDNNIIPPSLEPQSAVDSAFDDVSKAIDDLGMESPPSVGLDDGLSTQEAMPSAQNTVSIEPDTKEILDPFLNSETNLDAASELELEEKKSGGFFAGLMKLLIALGILGGAGYAVWKNKDELTGFATSLMAPAENVQVTKVEDPEPQAPAPEPIEEPAPEPVVPEPVVPEAVIPNVVVPEITQPQITEPETPELEIVEPEIIIPEPVPTQTQEPEVAEPTVIPSPTVETTPTTSEPSSAIPIGEVAYLYEEGSAGSGASRTNAAIIWETRQESIASGLAPEPVILGKMDIPDREMSINIKMRRNVDTAISASHMIEIKFNTPINFTGKSIESIARFVMKSTEEATGEPLVAVPIKVSEGSFLVALDNLTQAVALNTQLLKGSSWIDVPLVYGTGRRALITLEKGGTGERVFNEAFKDWQNR